MNSEKYIGLDVHQATISVAVMDSKGSLYRPVRRTASPHTRLRWLSRQLSNMRNGCLKCIHEECPSYVVPNALRKGFDFRPD
jgi:hypothetical protein